ncbi:MAG: hypothetical protein M5U14_02890 [Acidimicrobiia bacterium]|nr:hypothetical protein [Acidimicrobiia bacterium]
MVEGETCRVDGFGDVPVTRVQELLDQNPFVKGVLTDGIEVHKVKHFRRGLTAEQRTALGVLGARCCEPGCDRTDGLEIDPPRTSRRRRPHPTRQPRRPMPHPPPRQDHPRPQPQPAARRARRTRRPRSALTHGGPPLPTPNPDTDTGRARQQRAPLTGPRPREPAS